MRGQGRAGGRGRGPGGRILFSTAIKVLINQLTSSNLTYIYCNTVSKVFLGRVDRTQPPRVSKN